MAISEITNPQARQPAKLPASTVQLLFTRLIGKLREGGSFIHPSITRGSKAPLWIPGMLAQAPLENHDRIICIPPSFHITRNVVAQLAPDLVKAIEELGGAVKIYRSELSAFLAQQMHRVEHREVLGPEGDDQWSEADWLQLFIGTQLGEDFEYMPQFLLTKDCDARELFSPSSLLHTAQQCYMAVKKTHDTLVSQFRRHDLSPFEFKRFLQGYLMTLSRTLIRRVDSSISDYHMVPVGDMFNHAESPNCAWRFDGDGSFIVEATRSIHAGEELFISYGQSKSNARLFHTYGFTLPFHPDFPCSFRVWPAMGHDIYREFLPCDMLDDIIELDSHRVDYSLQYALTACDLPISFLRALCEHLLAEYRSDKVLQPLLSEVEGRGQSLRGDWWIGSTLEVEEGVKSNALQVKLCEFLCLTMHAEAMNIVLADELDEQPANYASNAGIQRLAEMLKPFCT